jgi:RecB family exonuclease
MADPRGAVRPRPGFDDDEIDADRQRRQRDSVWQAVLEKPANRRAEMAALAVVERLLREPEVSATSPADLDDHERRRRSRVDRHEVKFVTTDMDVPGEDGPA